MQQCLWAGKEVEAAIYAPLGYVLVLPFGEPYTPMVEVIRHHQIDLRVEDVRPAVSAID